MSGARITSGRPARPPAGARWLFVRSFVYSFGGRVGAVSVYRRGREFEARVNGAPVGRFPSKRLAESAGCDAVEAGAGVAS